MGVKGNIIDIHSRRIFPGKLFIDDGIIKNIEETKENEERYILPGLIDAHIHIESSMCTPGAFAVEAVSHGTTAVVADPHEIANVLGLEGVRFMTEDAKEVPLKFLFGAPSCVPATNYETSGASIDANDIEELFKSGEASFLAEMMNFPGVILDDDDVIEKINIARKYGKNIDGHSPGLSGKELKKYISKGITTDHECSTLQEALEKISLGMKILIREGSAARNLEALKDLLNLKPEKVMLCSDDLHPETLVERHINKIVAKLVKENFNLFDTIKACTFNPAKHYSINAGLLRINDPADFIIVDNPAEMNVLETWINGIKVFDRGNLLFNYSGAKPINKFNCTEISANQIQIKREGNFLRVIQAFDGELITREINIPAESEDYIYQSINKDILKIVVKDRYRNLPPVTGLINGFGLKRGAIASSVAHDSHNIICVGTNDDDIVNAVNEIVRLKGGLSVADAGDIESLALPVAGIMSDKPLKQVAKLYQTLTEKAKNLGCSLKAPFMTLSFMALLVIPELKISDRGLFDSKQFRFVPVTFNKIN